MNEKKVRKICEEMIKKSNLKVAGVFVMLCGILVQKGIISVEEMSELLSSENLDEICGYVYSLICDEKEK